MGQENRTRTAKTITPSILATQVNYLSHGPEPKDTDSSTRSSLPRYRRG
uniref:Uncharacterized protein MANES_15G164200 n=1 Tax=Rhizophora mucronata TaxID=61149 RepID=A0A2P2LAD4_RHIMU